VLGSASKLRSRLSPKRAAEPSAPCVEDVAAVARRSPYRPWAELLWRTFGFDVLACRRCEGRMRLLAMVTDAKSVCPREPRRAAAGIAGGYRLPFTAVMMVLGVGGSHAATLTCLVTVGVATVSGLVAA
jgi:hypothetical protein